MLVSAVVILLLVALNGVFAMGELALISARRARLAVLVRRGVPGADRALALSEDPQSFLPTVQVGITLVSILEGTFGGANIAADLAPRLARVPMLAPFAHELALALCVIVITALMLVLGELVPKQLALRRPEQIAARLSLPLLILARVAGPAVWLLNRSSSLVLRLVGVTKIAREAVTEEELKALIAEGAQAGVLEVEERNMIERLLRLADRPVRAIMTPRNELVWVDRLADPDTLRALLKSSEHTRMVVCDGDIDNPVGLILAKDVLDRLLDGGPLTVTDLMVAPVGRARHDQRVQRAGAAAHPSARHGAGAGRVRQLRGRGHRGGRVRGDHRRAAGAGRRHQEPCRHRCCSDPGRRLAGGRDQGSPRTRRPPRRGQLPHARRADPGAAASRSRGGGQDRLSGWLFEVLEMDGRRVHKVRASRQRLGGELVMPTRRAQPRHRKP